MAGMERSGPEPLARDDDRDPGWAAEDEAAVVATTLDYFEGWFDGDAARMERALHPELAKRRLGAAPRGAGERPGPEVPEGLDPTTAQEMIEATAEGMGKARDVPDRRIRIHVEDIYDTIASVTVRSAVYHEYLHLVRTRIGWRIANTIWQRT